MSRRAIIVAPDLFGSALDRGDARIWPPGADDVLGFQAIDDLLATDLTASGLTDAADVGCPSYRPLLDALAAMGFSADDAAPDLVRPFPFDWRVDVRTSADGLAAVIDALAAQRDEIILLGHGVGGLVCRNMLESGRHAKRTGLAKISHLITIDTPHLGAPQAVPQAMGQEAAATIPAADIVRLAADARFPALYQRFPAPGARVLWDVGDRLRPLNLYDPGVFQGLAHWTTRLDATQMRAAQAFWGEMSFARRPKSVRYVAFAGGDLAAVTHILRDGGVVRSGRAGAAGAGFAPLWSTAPAPALQTVVEGGEHAVPLTDDAAILALRQLLGAPLRIDAFTDTGRPRGRLLFANRAPSLSEEMAIAIKLAAPTKALIGSLRVVMADDPTAVVARYPLRYTGPATHRIEATLEAPSAAGRYALRVEGCPVDIPQEGFIATPIRR